MIADPAASVNRRTASGLPERVWADGEKGATPRVGIRESGHGCPEILVELEFHVADLVGMSTYRSRAISAP
jgi:hypothetical protein